MDFFDFIIITMQITNTIARKYDSSSDDESIENLVYYKDCHLKDKTTTAAPQMLREFVEPPPPTEKLQQPNCPFPKMCCALSCGNDCDGNKDGQSFTNRQFETLQQNMQPPTQPRPSRQPLSQVQQQPKIKGVKRKKAKAPIKLQPIPSRRDFVFTKDKIKSLIAQDDDIRKILKELVRVTMQKVDLLELINNNKEAENTPEIPKLTAEED